MVSENGIFATLHEIEKAGIDFFFEAQIEAIPELGVDYMGVPMQKLIECMKDNDEELQNILQMMFKEVMDAYNKNKNKNRP